jgi:hypothetical protein
MNKPTYSEKLKDPRWQKKRLEILNRDNWVCTSCGDNESTLHVHHMSYVNTKGERCEPWEVPSEFLTALCESCHGYESEGMAGAIDTLTSAAKSRFLSGNIQHLGCAIYHIKMVHSPDVVMSAIEHWLTREDKMIELVEGYFNYLSKRKNPF